MGTKLKTWDENLKLLLAQIRYPLSKCKRKFQCVSIVIKQESKSMFEQVLPEYSLAVDMVVSGATAFVKPSVQQFKNVVLVIEKQSNKNL